MLDYRDVPGYPQGALPLYYEHACQASVKQFVCRATARHPSITLAPLRSAPGEILRFAQDDR